MRAHIPPEPIQADLPRRGPAAGDFEHARRDAQRRVRGHHLDAGDPLGEVAALARRHAARLAVLGVYVGQLLADAVGQRLGGAEVREEVAVAFEDVEFFRGGVLVVAAEGPGARRRRRVFGGEGERAEGDAEVEVGEDELDRGEDEAAVGDAEDGGVGGAGLGIPAQSVGPGDLHLADLDTAGFCKAESDVVPVVLGWVSF